MFAFSSASGCGFRIHSPKRTRHSAAARHHRGLRAMMSPLHNGKPQASSVVLTAAANGSRRARVASAGPSASNTIALS